MAHLCLAAGLSDGRSLVLVVVRDLGWEPARGSSSDDARLRNSHISTRPLRDACRAEGEWGSEGEKGGEAAGGWHSRPYFVHDSWQG